jgi:signal transduction histidine kinase
MFPWLDRLAPPNDEDLDRARMLVYGALLLGSLHGLAAVLSTAVRGPNPLGIIIAFGTVGVFATIPLLKRTESVPTAAGWLFGVVYLNVSATAWLGYGFHSPALHAFMLFPVIGMLFGGIRIGLGLGAATILQVTALYGAHHLDVRFPLEVGGVGYTLFHYLVQSFMLGVLTLLLMGWERAWQRSRDRAIEARAEVERANQAKSTFLSNMSHELRTPLNAILGYVELVDEDARADQRDDLARVHDAGSHLLALVNDILDLARVESEHVSLTLTTVDLATLVEAVVAEVRPLVDPTRTELRVALDDAAPVEADPVRLRQVVLNLLSNAVKFTKAGAITVEARQTGEHVELDVRDTGPGLDPEEIDRVFEPFEQGEAGRGQGTGLGLAISRRLCQAMGAALTVRSVKGEGAVFTLVLVKPRA